MLYKNDKSDPNFQATTADPRYPLETHKSRSQEFGERNYEVTKLGNGIHVMTESSAFPSNVNMGILLDVGVRDETSETSGSLLSIQNTYLKTILNTNETINYGIVQMSGGSFEMEYDQESTYFKANCLAHDVVDVFSMAADCALEPRSTLAAQVGVSKNEDSHQLEKYVDLTGEAFNEAVFQTAFGLKNLGLPLKGLKGNVSNLNSYTLQKFQLENISPDRIYVCGAGIQSHSEFVDLVSDKLSFIPQVVSNQTQSREASEYLGGEVRNLTEDNTVSLGLLFQGKSWKDTADNQVMGLILANSLLNNIILPRLHQEKYYVDQAQGYNFSFSDNGLFGLKIIGDATNARNLLDDAVSQLKGLADQVNQDQLQQAKSHLKTNVLIALERQSDRLEEAVKGLKTYGKVSLDRYLSFIDSVTADQVSKAVRSAIQSNPTFVAHGGQANKLPSFDQIKNSLR